MKTAAYTLAKVQTFEGHSGIGLAADLLANGVNIAHVVDQADGACYSYLWFDREAEQQFIEYAKSLGKDSCEPWDELISMLFDITELYRPPKSAKTGKQSTREIKVVLATRRAEQDELLKYYSGQQH